VARPALAASRAIEVIELLVAHPTERFTLAEIQRRTGINPASAHALLVALARSGYVNRHPVNKTFGLGPALIAAGVVAAVQQPALAAGRRELDALSAELGLEVLLTAATEHEIIVVGRSALSTDFGRVLHVGQRVPLQPPLGTVFLAWSSEADVERWLDRARPSLTDAERAVQRRALEAVRARRYAIGLESFAQIAVSRFAAELARSADDDSQSLHQLFGELIHGTYHLDAVDPDAVYDPALVAAAIFDAGGRVVGAITANGLPPGMRGADVTAIAERLSGVALRITKDTHGRLPQPDAGP
jgi:DNA-binding IclR family transcriptional regulator